MGGSAKNSRFQLDGCALFFCCCCFCCGIIFLLHLAWWLFSFERLSIKGNGDVFLYMCRWFKYGVTRKTSRCAAWDSFLALVCCSLYRKSAQCLGDLWSRHARINQLKPKWTVTQGKARQLSHFKSRWWMWEGVVRRQKNNNKK